MKHIINTIGLFIILVLLTITYICTGDNYTYAKENVKSCIEDCDTKNKYEFKKTDNIVFFGDSITDHYPLDKIYGENAPIVNSGISGYKTQDLLDKIEPMLYQYNPTKVFMLIGINDIATNTKTDNVEQLKDNLEKLVKNISENRSKAKIYVESLYPVNKKLRGNSTPYPDDINDKIVETNKVLKEICKKYNATYIDMYSFLVDSKGELKEDFTDDGLHVNGIGYAKITKELIPYIYE